MHLIQDSKYGILQGLTYFEKPLDFLFPFNYFPVLLHFLLIINATP